jgi:putative endonuclease
MKSYYVYILASGRQGTLYTGITDDLIRRVGEHKKGKVQGFTKKYVVDQLVYYEDTNDIRTAIEREKHIKTWNREWKIKLIEEDNPEWRDLYLEILES